MNEIDAFMEYADHALRKVMGDGATKRAAGLKPIWKEDKHVPSFRRHVARWELGEKEDVDSGAHPLVHAACRALMIAWQETRG